MDQYVATQALLAHLINFDTTSRNPNIELMQFMSQWLESNHIESKLIPNKNGSKAKLYATVGPEEGNFPFEVRVILSGHTDVAPIEGHKRTNTAFKLTQ